MKNPFSKRLPSAMSFQLITPENANRQVFVDVRSFGGEMDELPLRYGTVSMVHSSNRPCAVELEFENPIQAYEEARRLNKLGLHATCIKDSKAKLKLLQTIIAQEEARAANPIHPHVKAAAS